MKFQPLTISESKARSLLREHGINPTAQRVLITQTLLARGTHLAAEDLFRLVNAASRRVSRATVYNTLGLLAEKGLVRAVIADRVRVSYDPNISPHYHFYDEVTGELTDIDTNEIQIAKLPALPEGVELQGVDVIVRVRRSGKGNA